MCINMNVSYAKDIRDGDEVSSSEDNEVSSPEPKRRRTNRVWLLRETFANLKEVEDAIQARLWKKSASIKTTSGLQVS